MEAPALYPAPPPPAGPPPAVPGYEVLRELDRGGMGVVYQARDTRLGRFVALKFLPPKAAQEPRLLEQFRREARAASALNHPAVCTLHGLGEYQGQPYLILEFQICSLSSGCGGTARKLRPDSTRRQNAAALPRTRPVFVRRRLDRRARLRGPRPVDAHP